MKKIGIFGGSFNPVQIAHLIIAERFVEECRLEKCLFIPANISPFKIEDQSQFISPEHRLKILSLALPDNGIFEIDDCEIKRGGISNTIDTIDYIERKYPHYDIFMLIGSDHAKAFNKWKDWKEILKKVTLCIARRPHTLDDSEKPGIEDILSSGKKIVWIDIPLIEISSSEIRDRIRESKSINYLVPEKVIDYVKLNKLFL